MPFTPRSFPSLDAAVNSPERLAALRQSGLLDSPPEPEFDHITALVAKVLKVPLALVSLIDRDRQFFKSSMGLSGTLQEARETPLSYSVCKHVVQDGRPLVIRDAGVEPLFCDNQGVREYGIVAYLGYPLLDEEGNCFGTLCAVDYKARDWTEEDMGLMRALGSQVSSEIQLRLKAARLAEDLSGAKRVDAERRTLTRMTLHDLRTPLSSLLLTVEMIPVLGELNSQQRDYIRLCLKACENLRNLVDSLLDVEACSVQDAAGLRVSPCDAAGIARNALEQVGQLAREFKIQLDRQIEPGLPLLQADAPKLTRVLVNLLGNALKFTAPSGRVILRVSRDPQASGYVLFTVADSGIGIGSADTKRIFDEGVRLDGSASGRISLGLGLAFCKRMVEAHGGGIWVASEVGRGSEFFVSLPSVEVKR